MAPRRKWRRADEAVGGEGRRLAAGMQLQPNLSEHRARCRFLIKKKVNLVQRHSMKKPSAGLKRDLA